MALNDLQYIFKAVLINLIMEYKFILNMIFFCLVIPFVSSDEYNAEILDVHLSDSPSFSNELSGNQYFLDKPLWLGIKYKNLYDESFDGQLKIKIISPLGNLDACSKNPLSFSACSSDILSSPKQTYSDYINFYRESSFKVDKGINTIWVELKSDKSNMLKPNEIIGVYELNVEFWDSKLSLTHFPENLDDKTTNYNIIFPIDEKYKNYIGTNNINKRNEAFHIFQSKPEWKYIDNPSQAVEYLKEVKWNKLICDDNSVIDFVSLTRSLNIPTTLVSGVIVSVDPERAVSNLSIEGYRFQKLDIWNSKVNN